MKSLKEKAEKMKQRIDQGAILDVEIEKLRKENVELRKRTDENVLAKSYKDMAALNIQLLDKLDEIQNELDQEKEKSMIYEDAYESLRQDKEYWHDLALKQGKTIKELKEKVKSLQSKS